MACDPKAREVMEWRQDEGDEGGDELSRVSVPSLETTVTPMARAHPADQIPRSPVVLGFLA